jgi:dihydrofolate reductase
VSTLWRDSQHPPLSQEDIVRRIINSTYISLDGVIKNPQTWPTLEGHDDAGSDLQLELLQQCDAVLLGKETFESFASVWEGQSGDPYTDQINRMTKYVVSSTLAEPSWENSTVITGDPAAEVRRIKGQPGKDIVTYGFGRLGRALMEHGLLDEIRLWVHPFFIGGTDTDSLLFGHSPAARLDLANTQALKNGIIVLSYTVRHKPK